MFQKIQIFIICSLLSIFACLYSINNAEIVCMQLGNSYVCSIKQISYLFIEENIDFVADEVYDSGFFLMKNIELKNKKLNKTQEVLNINGVFFNQKEVNIFIESFNNKKEMVLELNLFSPNLIILLMSLISIVFLVIKIYFAKTKK